MKFYEKPSYLGCADAVADKSKLKQYKQQFKEMGFDDTVTWNLDVQIVKFIYPRLKRYYELAFKQIDEPKLEADIKKILFAFKLYVEKDGMLNSSELKKFNNAKTLLNVNFLKLWW